MGFYYGIDIELKNKYNGYDENGQLYGFIKDNAKYFYVKDITDTILGIVNESGELVGKYSYSAYGKCTVLVNVDGIAKKIRSGSSATITTVNRECIIVRPVTMFPSGAGGLMRIVQASCSLTISTE